MLPRRAESTAQEATQPPRSEQVAQEFKLYFQGTKLNSPEFRVLKDEVAINAALENLDLHRDDEVAKQRAIRALMTKKIRRHDPLYNEKLGEVNRLTEKFYAACLYESATDFGQEYVLLCENTKKEVLAPQPATPPRK